MAQVSVAIYVPNYVPHLFEMTLKSVVEQTVSSLEILVVDDCRTYSESKSVKSLLKKSKKSLALSYGKSLRFLSMGGSSGYADSLRTAVNDSSGKYFSVLFMGDVFCSSQSLSRLIKISATKRPLDDKDWDLIQGCVIAKEKDMGILEIDSRAYDIVEKNSPEILIADDSDTFLSRYIMEEKHTLCIEGKLFLRETLFNALERMPRLEVYCGVEYLWMYFFCRQAKTLLSVEEKTVVRDLDLDISSGDFEIDNPDRWCKICSSASVFSSIFFDLFDRPMKSPSFYEYLRTVMSRYAISNARHLKRVHPSIQAVCLAIFEESWGDEVAKQTLEFVQGS